MIGRKPVYVEIPATRSGDQKNGQSLSLSLKDTALWVWENTRSEIFVMALAMGASAAVSALPPVALVLAKRFVSEAAARGAVTRLLPTTGGLILIFLATSVLRMVYSLLGALASTKVRRNLEIACFRHLSELGKGFVESRASGWLVAAYTTEIPLVAGMIEVALRSFVRAPLTILVLLGYLFINDRMTAIAAALCAPLFFLGLRFFSSLAAQASFGAFQDISQMYANLQEHLAGIRVVHSMGLLKWSATRMEELSRSIALKSRRAAVMGGAFQAIQELFSLVVLLGFLTWLSWRVLHGEMSIEQALVVPVGLYMIRNEAGAFASGIIRMKKTRAASRRLLEILAAKPKQRANVKFSGPLTSIRLEKVCYAYPKGPKVLNEISLDLSAGEMIAVIGNSGAGKSTLCDLCLRFRVPDRGIVQFNGLCGEDLNEAHLRSQTALVEQEPYLFSGTIRNNMIFMEKKEMDRDIWHALEMARADEFVKKLPKGLETPIGENGHRLSTGQKQRLVLARAILKKPHFLVLDEFTSSLDPENEAFLLDTLVDLSKQIIVMCTTHRMSVAKRAGRVYRLESGRLERVYL